ncbi:hypothetical protein ACN27B_04275 [Micromonospora sp. WMMD754]|uniref:hypothetical protein n=1 Tax=Micromonospora sp. WMMD754 TaxID=3404114 RepID=UPI003BF4DA3E
MRWWRTAAASLLLLPGGLVAGAPAASAAADQAPPVLAGITVSPDAVSVSGVDLVPVTVSAHLTDETGVEPSGEMDGSNLPAVTLLRAAGADATASQSAELSLTSGTPQDGVWSATIQVPSTWDGEWEVSRLVAVDSAANRLDVDPPASADTRLAVTGTHKPAVTMRFAPDPLAGDGPLTVEGRFYDEDTGKGIGNQPIYFGQDNLCVESPSPPNGTTRADGTFSRVYPRGDDFLHCVGILRPSDIRIATSFIVVAARHPRVRPLVSVTASSTSVAPGRKVTFTGTVKPSTPDVVLQQLRGGTWRKVAGASVGDGGRYTLSVTPPTAGTFRYRVVAPKDDPALAGVSETVTVRVVAPGGAGQPDGGSGGGSGTLPITGPAIPSLVGSAAALLLAGAGLMLVARRRRVVTATEGHVTGR